MLSAIYGMYNFNLIVPEEKLVLQSGKQTKTLPIQANVK